MLDEDSEGGSLAGIEVGNLLGGGITKYDAPASAAASGDKIIKNKGLGSGVGRLTGKLKK